jgi:hypothetical protein
VREGGRQGAERGPSSSPLLLLFCCFSASPILARSLARFAKIRRKKKKKKKNNNNNNKEYLDEERARKITTKLVFARSLAASFL